MEHIEKIVFISVFDSISQTRRIRNPDTPLI